MLFSDQGGLKAGETAKPHSEYSVSSVRPHSFLHFYEKARPPPPNTVLGNIQLPWGVAGGGDQTSSSQASTSPSSHYTVGHRNSVNNLVG